MKDSFNVPVGSRSSVKLVSDPALVSLFYIKVGPDRDGPIPIGFWMTQDSGESTVLFESASASWETSPGAVCFAMNQDKVMDITLKSVQAPYWAVVIPLTLFSAYLLLSKTGPLKRTESIG